MGFFKVLLSFGSASLVNFGDNRVADPFQLLQFLFVLFLGGIIIAFQPGAGLIQGFLDGILLTVFQFIGQFGGVFHSVLHGVDIIFQRVLGIDLFFQEFILFGKLFGISQHLFDLFLGQSALIVGNHDFFGLVAALIGGTDLEDTIGINFEGHFNLWHATGGRGNASQVKLAQQVVVLDHGAFTFEH